MCWSFLPVPISLWMSFLFSIPNADVLCLQMCLAPTFPQISYSQPCLEFLWFYPGKVQEKVLSSPVHLCDAWAVTLLLPVQGGLPTGTQQACTRSCFFLGSSLSLKCRSKWTVPGVPGEQWEVCHSLGHWCWASSSPGAVSRSPSGSHCSFSASLQCDRSRYYNLKSTFAVSALLFDIHGIGGSDWRFLTQMYCLSLSCAQLGLAGCLSLGESLWLLWKEVRCTDERAPDLGWSLMLQRKPV